MKKRKSKSEVADPARAATPTLPPADPPAPAPSPAPSSLAGGDADESKGGLTDEAGPPPDPLVHSNGQRFAVAYHSDEDGLEADLVPEAPEPGAREAVNGHSQSPEQPLPEEHAPPPESPPGEEVVVTTATAAEPTPEPAPEEPAEPIPLGPLPILVSAPPAVLVAQPAVLEERVHRLEQTIDSLLRERQALSAPVLAAVPVPVPVARIATEADVHTVAEPAVHSLATVATLVDVGQRLLGSPMGSTPAHAAGGRRERRGWAIFEALAEVRVILRMYVDPRYRMSWLGRTVPTFVLPAIVLSFLWVPMGAYQNVGWFICKPFELVLTYALIKVLEAEVRRYRELTPDLPASLR